MPGTSGQQLSEGQSIPPGRAVARTAAACSSCYLLRKNAWPCVSYLSSFQCCYFCDPTVLKSLLPAIEEQVAPSTILPGKWCLFPFSGTSVEITCSTPGPEFILRKSAW